MSRMLLCSTEQSATMHTHHVLQQVFFNLTVDGWMEISSTERLKFLIVQVPLSNCGLGSRSGDSQHVPSWAALAKVEETDFIQPMLIGEVAKVHAELSFASKHSVEVTVYVWAENLKSGTERLTNKLV
eukprot:gene15039-16592_t